MMLTLIIPREESVTSSNVDVYLQPLIDELCVVERRENLGCILGGNI
jgi:hypothetical protein